MAASVLQQLLTSPDSPRVRALALATGEPLAVAAGAALCFLCYAARFADERGLIKHATHEILAGVYGFNAEFWKAAEAAGLFRSVEGGIMAAKDDLRLLTFEADRRAKDRARQAKSRAGRDVDRVSRDCHSDVTKCHSDVTVTETQVQQGSTTYDAEPAASGEEGGGGVLGRMGLGSAVLGEEEELQRFELEPVKSAPSSAGRKKSRDKKLPASPVIPPELDTPQFRTLWETWLANRRQMKHPVTDITAAAKLKRLAGWGIERAVAALELTIEKGWRDIIEPGGGESFASRQAPPPRPRYGVDIEKVLPLQGGSL